MTLLKFFRASHINWYSLVTMLFSFSLYSMQEAKSKEVISTHVYKLVKESNTTGTRRRVIDLSGAPLADLENPNSLVVTEGTSSKKITELPRLRLLLAHNQLNDLPAQLCMVTNLEELNLRYNQFRVIDAPLILIFSLRKLNLSGNQLAQLPDELTMLLHLTALDVSFNRLRMFPEVLTHMTNLTNLDLSGNTVDRIPDAIRKLTLLKKLDLNDTGLALSSQTVRVLKTLTQLRRLSLCKNELEALPENFGTLGRLVEIYLDHNKLADLPNSLAGLFNFAIGNTLPKYDEEGLRIWRFDEEGRPINIINESILSLSHNRFSRFPPILLQFVGMQRLHLDHNFITELPDISKLECLTYLDLSSNRLRKINLLPVNDLYYLILNNNRLTSLPSLPHVLVCFEARHNLLVSLPNMLTRCVCLARLSLEDNRLGVIVNGKPKPVHSLNDIDQFKSHHRGKPFKLKLFLEKLTGPVCPEIDHKVLGLGDNPGYLSLLSRGLFTKVYTYLYPPTRGIRWSRGYSDCDPRLQVALFADNSTERKYQT